MLGDGLRHRSRDIAAFDICAVPLQRVSEQLLPQCLARTVLRVHERGYRGAGPGSDGGGDGRQPGGPDSVRNWDGEEGPGLLDQLEPGVPAGSSSCAHRVSRRVTSSTATGKVSSRTPR